MPWGAAAAAAVGAGGSYLAAKESNKAGTVGSTNTRTRIPDWLKQPSQDAVGLASQIADRQFNARDAAHAYGINDLQQSGLQQARGLAGGYTPFLDAASNALGAGGQAFTDADLSAYMNPYTANVLDVSARKLGEGFEQQRNQRNMNAAARGAFGGLRNTLGNDLAEQGYLQSLGDLYTQGLGSAWDRGAARWSADRANQQNQAARYGSLAQLTGGLDTQSMNAALNAGGVQRQADLAQYLEGRDWDQNQRLSPLLQAVSTVPHGGTNIGSSQGTQSQQLGLGNQIGAGLGGGLAAYGAYNQFAGGNTDSPGTSQPTGIRGGSSYTSALNQSYF